MTITEELQRDINNIEKNIMDMPKITCTHLTCTTCEAIIEEQKKSKEILTIQLTEKKQLLGRIQSYVD